MARKVEATVDWSGNVYKDAWTVDLLEVRYSLANRALFVFDIARSGSLSLFADSARIRGGVSVVDPANTARSFYNTGTKTLTNVSLARGRSARASPVLWFDASPASWKHGATIWGAVSILPTPIGHTLSNEAVVNLRASDVKLFKVP